MQTLHIQRLLESETVPELKPLIGRNVEIVVREMPTTSSQQSGIVPGTGDWDAFQRAVEALSDSFDFEAIERQNECDWVKARNRLP